MNETDIRHYAELMQEMGLTGLEITEDNKKVRLERMIPAGNSFLPNMPNSKFGGDVPGSAGDLGGTSIKQREERMAEAVDYGCMPVCSPLVGIFYAAPAENADPYVSIGDHVKKGQVLCLVEAMKLMNEIVAEEDGVIAKICATNGQVVEYGTELFQIKQAG